MRRKEEQLKEAVVTTGIMTMIGSEVVRTSTGEEEEEEAEIMDSPDQELEVTISHPVAVVVEDTVTTEEVKMTEDQGQDMKDREEDALTTIIEETTTEDETTGMIREGTMVMATLPMAMVITLMDMAMPGLGVNQTPALEEEEEVTTLTTKDRVWRMTGLEVESLVVTMEVGVLDLNSDLLDFSLEQLCHWCSLLVPHCPSNRLEEVLEAPGVLEVIGMMPIDPTT